ncbi:hypothetical protein K1719_027520 [Acacia pycnantha]|nr:hypothetical protein K1719_027520 [Acacia pycnantha]
MFLIKLPIPVGNTVTLLPKPRIFPCAHSQTHRFFPPSSLFPDFQSRKTVVHLSRGVDAVSGSLPLTEPEPEPLPPELLPDLMPKHVAVSMDGNRRWAKMRGLPTTAGYEAGLESMMRIIDLSCSWQIKVLTLFWFSYDNWKRPKVR